MTKDHKTPQPGDMILYPDDGVLCRRWKLALVHKVGKTMWEVSHRETDFSALPGSARWSAPARRKILRAHVILGDPDEIKDRLYSFYKLQIAEMKEAEKTYTAACLALADYQETK